MGSQNPPATLEVKCSFGQFQGTVAVPTITGIGLDVLFQLGDARPSSSGCRCRPARLASPAAFEIAISVPHGGRDPGPDVILVCRPHHDTRKLQQHRDKALTDQVHSRVFILRHSPEAIRW